jgi:hypothetical protein
VDAVSYKGEGQVLVLLWRDPRRVVSQDENRHLELVVAHVRVGIPHLECPLPHQDRTGLLDEIVHIRGARERG